MKYRVRCVENPHLGQSYSGPGHTPGQEQRHRQAGSKYGLQVCTFLQACPPPLGFFCKASACCSTSKQNLASSWGGGGIFGMFLFGLPLKILTANLLLAQKRE